MKEPAHLKTEVVAFRETSVKLSKMKAKANKEKITFPNWIRKMLNASL